MNFRNYILPILFQINELTFHFKKIGIKTLQVKEKYISL